MHEQAIDGVAAARDDGLRVVALELTEDATPVFDVALDDDLCIVVGNESNGTSAAVLEACDAVAYLPLLGRVGSLNVATATAIALYEARRQGWARGEHRG